MYAQKDNTAPLSSPTSSENVLQLPAEGMIMAINRATLRTRPRIQRALIRSWEYIEPVRITVLVIRLLVVLWLFFLGTVLISAGHGWAWALPVTGLAVLALSVWVFTTAAKGWPAAEA